MQVRLDSVKTGVVDGRYCERICGRNHRHLEVKSPGLAWPELSRVGDDADGRSGTGVDVRYSEDVLRVRLAPVFADFEAAVGVAGRDSPSIIKQLN